MGSFATPDSIAALATAGGTVVIKTWIKRFGDDIIFTKTQTRFIINNIYLFQARIPLLNRLVQ